MDTEHQAHRVAGRRHSNRSSQHSYHLPKTSATSLDGDAYVKIQSLPPVRADKVSRIRTPFSNLSNVVRKRSQSPVIAGPRYSKYSNKDLATQMDSWALDTSIGHIETANLLQVRLKNLSDMSSVPKRAVSFPGLPDLPAPSSLHMSSFFGRGGASPMSVKHVSAKDCADDEYAMTQELPVNTVDLMKHEMPRVLHPNSPYVPWSLNEREKILCHQDESFCRSLRSPPTSKRSGRLVKQSAQPQSAQGTVVKLRVSNSLRNITLLARKNIKKFGIRLSRIAGPPQFTLLAKASPSNPTATPSCQSVESSESTSLATWLAARQEENDALLSRTEAGILIEDYEDSGSWKDVKEVRNSGDFLSGFPIGRQNGGVDAEYSPRMPGGWVAN